MRSVGKERSHADGAVMCRVQAEVQVCIEGGRGGSGRVAGAEGGAIKRSSSAAACVEAACAVQECPRGRVVVPARAR